jgi:hypothetical protein
MKRTKIVKVVFELFEDSNYFMNEAKKCDQDSSSQQRFVRASILSAWAGFEGWINKTCFDLAKTLKNLTVHDRGFLLEKKVELKNGLFNLSNSDNYETIEHKIEFLVINIAHGRLDKKNRYWKNFKAVKGIRDSIVHPKETRNMACSIVDCDLTIETLKYYIALLAKKVYKSTLNL